MNILDTLLIFKGDAKPALEQMALMREGLSKVQDQHEKTSSSLMGGIVKAGVFAVGAVAVGAFFEALHSGVEAYSAAEVATGKLDTTLKDQGVSLAANRDEVEKTQASMRGLAHTNAQTTDSVTTLVQAHVPLAEALKDQTTLADLAAEKFGGDLQAATDAVAKGANGRLNPALKEMGVHLKKGETGAAAMADILAQTSKQVDGQAATYAHTMPGALDVMRASWDNIAESIGKKVVPYIERVAGWVTDHQPQIQSFADGTLAAVGTAFDIVGKAVGFVADHFDVLKPILITIGGVWLGMEVYAVGAATVVKAVWLAEKVSFIAGQVAKGAAWSVFYVQMWAEQAAFMAKNVAAWLAEKATFIAGLVIKEALWLASMAVLAASALATGIAAAAAFLLPLAPFILIGLAVAGLVYLVVTHFSQIRDFIGTVVSDVVSFFRDHWQLLIAIALGPLGVILGLVITHFGQIKSFIGTVISDVVSFFTSLPGKIVGALGNLGSLLLNAGGQIIAGLLKGITDKFAEVKNFVGGIASSIASLKGPLDYDRKLLVPHGNAIMDGLGAGLASGFGRVQDQVSGMALNLASSVGPISGGAGAGGGSGVTINQTVNLAAGMDPSQIVPQMKTANDNLLTALQQQLVVR